MLAELSFQHAFYLVQDVRMADICLASPFYLPCLRYHVLRAYCKFASKQAISITLFGARPNNKRCNISSVITPKKISYGSPRKWTSNFTKLHLHMKERQRITCVLNYSGARFYPLRIKITQFPSWFRLKVCKGLAWFLFPQGGLTPSSSKSDQCQISLCNITPL